ncbi:membrane peptidoglycan carboxypeptidase [Leucobacter exalbidus]|uniref:Membrane peptidoglycan carboxypeptidase n=1 Tax=Leucobacter exalbidus TaxID=662960 RepID=A0A940PX77_9MICO|nr:transglycosylase domain-containing protein [Leucobacter exalbidus]MBP1327009.1 membrane peptidoglycan carboxypeptidase [Leucobacter exalbidus]
MTRQTSSSSRVRTVKPRTAGGALGGIIGALAMSLIAGVLVTAAVTPVVAISGISAGSAIDIFEKLPNHLNPSRLAEPSTLYATSADGQQLKLAEFYDQDRETVQWDDIPQFVKDATVAEEDPRFYTHGGVDVLATARAVLQNAAGQNLSGASTVTMQYVRNVLIQESIAIPDPEEQTAAYKKAMEQTTDRKLKEMRYAISIEKQYAKDDILLGYLNIALFGRKIYGIQSAAHYYYNKDAKDLSLAESASLVAIVNNPAKLQIDVEENIPANTERRDKILNSMLTRGKITQAQFDEAIATPVTPDITPREAGCFLAEKNYGLGHFCDYVQRYIKQDASFGDNPTDREFNFSRGGYSIMTTIDLDMQAAGLDAMHNTVPAMTEGIDVGAATSSVEVGTGRVFAMMQNKPYSNEQAFLDDNPSYTGINYNTDFEYGGSNGFQVASTFKAITLAEWIRTGHSVRDVVNVNSRTVEESSFAASCMPDGRYGFGSFSFTNDNEGTRGNQPVLTAIGNSVNGGLVSMQQKMDLCETFDTAKKLGIHRASVQTNPDVANYGTTDLTMVPSNVYGGIDEIAPITMATAYGAFAGDGTVCTPVPIDSIVDTDGKEVPFTKSKCTEGVSPEVAAGVAYALQYAVTNGLAKHAGSAYGVPHLAKTGTSDDVIDNWTVGASTKVATATWVGNAGPVQFADGSWGRVSTQHIGNLMYADQTLWPAVMNVADAKYGGDAFPEPSAASVKVTLVPVPEVKGKSFEEATKLLTSAGFNVSDGGEVDSSAPKDTAAGTSPGAGEQVGLGSGISLQRSNGKGGTIPDGLTGQSGNDARSALRDAGFNNIDFSCEAKGKTNPGSQRVVSVSPESGSEANMDSTVTVTLDCGKKSKDD